MRQFIIKAGLLQFNISTQIIYIFFTTLFFSFIYALITIWFAKALHWGNELISLYSIKNKTSVLLMLSYSNCLVFGIWNLIYFSYYYLEKSRSEQINKIRLENELKVQQLESERTKSELQRQTIEIEIKAMVATRSKSGNAFQETCTMMWAQSFLP
ncbi:MAG: hypothetical protein WKG06_22385 [Segetibacter sp.]